MISKARAPEQYLQTLPSDKREAVEKLRETILKNLPKGFSEEISYGMIGCVVPLSLYPSGYHCNPEQPLPFLCLASQKNYLALYHMGLYAIPDLLKWFTTEYPKSSKTKLDMGKSCIRFKKTDQIPDKLIGELMKKITPQKWIEAYEYNLNKSNN